MDLRRSARVSGTRLQSCDSEVNEEGEVENGPDDIDPSYKKRRVAASKPSTTGMGKKRKGGKLKQLPEMPLEILLEVFSRLYPHDLLRLARTTKALRNILMHRSSRAIWKDALANADLPECPPDLTEPQYAHLAFESRCHFCETTGVHTIIWTCRLRSCKACIEKNFISRWAVDVSLRVICKCMPYTSIRRSKRRPWENIYPKTVVEKFGRLWNELLLNGSQVERDEFIKQKLQEMSDMQHHAELCEAWSASVGNNRAQELDATRQRRNDAILERLRAIGWGNEIDMMSPGEKTDWARHPIVKQPKDLTNRIWTNNRSALVEYMEGVKTRRLEDERILRMRKRHDIAVRLLEEYTTKRPWTEPVPGPGDVCLMDDFKAIIDLPAEVEVTEDSFAEAMQHLPQLSEEWRVSVERKLMSLIPPLDGSHEGQSGSDFSRLRLAKNAFNCKYCFDEKHMDFDHIITHYCLTSRPWRVFDSVETDSDLKKRCLAITADGRVPWNFEGNAVHFNKKSSEAAERIIVVCGENPETITYDEMDKLDVRVECSGCLHDSWDDRSFAMTWRGAIRHLLGAHVPRNITFKRLSEAEATTVKKIEAEKPLDQHEIIVWCARCRMEHSMMSLRMHLHHRHGIDDLQPRDYHSVPGCAPPVSFSKATPGSPSTSESV